MRDQQTETVHESLSRCTHNPRFLDIFYEHFFNASPEIRDIFAGIDMKRQARALEASLYLSILAADRSPYAIATIERLGERHRNLGVRPALYEMWLDSLIAAVAACDDAFDEHLEAAWRAVMRESITVMLSRYEVPS